MKKSPFVVLFLTVILFSCKKETAKCPYSQSTIVASQTEKDSIQRYLNANGLVATRDTSGVFYSISAQGTGVNPSICSNLTVGYVGSLFTGFVFDATSGSKTANFDLGGVIVGWQKGLPYLKNGGTITLYIPPSLGYGGVDVRDNNVVVIPANSYLKFTINLVNVQ